MVSLLNPDTTPEPSTSEQPQSTFTHDGKMEILPDGTQIWRGDGPPPEVLEQMKKDAETPQTCLRDGCKKMLPGKGWCSLKHRDEYQRATYGFAPRAGETRRMFSKGIPKNIQVEIAKGHGYWYDKYQEYQRALRVAMEEELEKQRMANEQLDQAVEAADMLATDSSANPTASTTSS